MYPERIDGYFYAYVNSYSLRKPVGHRGSQVILRSRDMVHFARYGVALECEECDRMETAQVFRHGDKWCMYFGAAIPRDG